MTGSYGAVLVISLGAMIATVSVLLSTVMEISRIVFSMTAAGICPRCLTGSIPGSAHRTNAIAGIGACMIAALLVTDHALVVSVSTFSMLLLHDRQHRRPPAVRGASPVSLGSAGQRLLSCVGLFVFLSPVASIIGCIGLAMGGVWYVFRRKFAT